jgi:hypothetical protein
MTLTVLIEGLPSAVHRDMPSARAELEVVVVDRGVHVPLGGQELQSPPARSMAAVHRHEQPSGVRRSGTNN